MLSEKENLKPAVNLDANASRISFALLLSSILGAATLFWLYQQTDLEFVYNYGLFTAAVAVINLVGVFLVYKNYRVAGIGFLQAGLIASSVSIPFGFLDIGLIIAFVVGFSVWQISLLTLEGVHLRRATFTGVFFALAIIALDLYWPYQRLLLRELTIAAYIISPGLIVFFLFLFYRNLDQYNIQTKLVTMTVALAIVATGAALIIESLSTRTILTEATQVEIELRAEGVAAEISTEFDRQVDRLVTLGTNQQIEEQILFDKTDLEGFENDIVQLILDRRNRIWINADGQFAINRHVAFFSRLRNPTADILRSYKQSFPETHQLFIINETGAVVAMSSRNDINRYLYDDTDWWRQITEANNSDPFIGNPIPSEIGDGLIIPIAVPVRDINNNLIGILYSAYSVNELILSLGDIGPTEPDGLETNFAMLFDNQAVVPLVPAQNTILTSPFPELVIQDLFQMNFIELQTLSSNNILTAVPFSISTDRPENNADPSYIPDTWGILVSRPLETVETVIRDQQRLQITIGLIIILGTVAFAALLARAVSAPITRLAGVAQKLETGELSARASVASADEVGSLSVAFNQMAEQSQRLVNQLETRVAERTQALETSFRVSQTISSITDKNELVTAVVNQLQSAFDYYHVHIYLVDDAKQALEMVAGSGETGERLMIDNHTLEMGRGLVGRAAQSGLAVIVPDVTQDPQWVANRFLPETKSELAVPISLGEEVLGVIDVQDDEVNRLSEQDADLLRSIADQVAVALQNAEQIKIERERANREAQINAIREKILGTQDVDSAMKTAIREIGFALGNRQTAIQLKPAAARLVQDSSPTLAVELAEAGQTGHDDDNDNDGELAELEAGFQLGRDPIDSNADETVDAKPKKDDHPDQHTNLNGQNGSH